VPAAEEVPIEPPVFFEPQVTERKAEIRFAEDILAPRPDKPVEKPKKKKKGVSAKESAEDGIRIKRRRRDTDFLEGDEEY